MRVDEQTTVIICENGVVRAERGTELELDFVGEETNVKPQPFVLVGEYGNLIRWENITQREADVRNARLRWAFSCDFWIPGVERSYEE